MLKHKLIICESSLNLSINLKHILTIVRHIGNFVKDILHVLMPSIQPKQ